MTSHHFRIFLEKFNSPLIKIIIPPVYLYELRISEVKMINRNWQHRAKQKAFFIKNKSIKA